MSFLFIHGYVSLTRKGRERRTLLSCTYSNSIESERNGFISPLLIAPLISHGRSKLGGEDRVEKKMPSYFFPTK